MKTKTTYSENLDPYKAGIELAENIKEIKPEIIFIFSSIHYNGSAELLEAIYDIIDNEKLIVFGNTGDGFYETNKVANIGISALAINTNGAVKWNLHYEKGIGKAPYKTAKKCLNSFKIKNLEHKSNFYFMATDFRTDGTEIMRGIQEIADAPIIGGMAADSYNMEKSFVYANKEVLEDSIVILAVVGKISFDISVAQNMKPVGKQGKITSSIGTQVKTINNMPAMDFIKQEIGKPLDSVDEGVITFKLTDDKNENQHEIRSLLLSKEENNKSVTLYGGVQEGNNAIVCLAQPKKIIADVTQISKNLSNLDFEPKAALIVSCAGRKNVLANNIADEVNEIKKYNKSIESIIGYPSFGEIGPVKNNGKYSKPLFHNMTFILLTIG